MGISDLGFQILDLEELEFAIATRWSECGRKETIQRDLDMP